MAARTAPSTETFFEVGGPLRITSYVAVNKKGKANYTTVMSTVDPILGIYLVCFQEWLK